MVGTALGTVHLIELDCAAKARASASRPETFSNQAIPAGYAMPANALSFYQGLTCPSDAKRPRCSQVYTGSPSPAIMP